MQSTKRRKALPPGLGIRCVVVREEDCAVCTIGECDVCGENGSHERGITRGRMWARGTRRVFWELRPHVGRVNILREVKYCKHCDANGRIVLDNAAKLTMRMMEEKVRSAEGGRLAVENVVEKVFWQILVKEKESALGTVWLECPTCGKCHSVHEECENSA